MLLKEGAEKYRVITLRNKLSVKHGKQDSRENSTYTPQQVQRATVVKCSAPNQPQCLHVVSHSHDKRIRSTMTGEYHNSRR
jgi:hypothetical protein